MATKTAVVLFAYKRPHYFRQCVESVRANWGIEDATVIAVLDGGRGSTQTRNTNILKAANFPRLQIVARRRHRGIFYNKVSGLMRVFREGYDRVMVVEDDVLVSPSYLQLTGRILDWAAREGYDDVGMASGNNRFIASRGEKAAYLNQVVAGNTGLWSYMMLASTWERIRPNMGRFIAMWDAGDSPQKRGKWLVGLLKSEKFRPGDRVYPSSQWDDRYAGMRDGKGLPAAGYDGGICCTMAAEGLCSLHTVVNRAVHIGEHGTHSWADRWDRVFGQVRLDVFEEDADLLEFQIVEGQKPKRRQS
jgi:hypothetical protein